MKVVDATAEHLALFYGDRPRRTCRGWAVLDGETVIGVAGFYREGVGNLIFTVITDELRQHPRVIVGLAKRILVLLMKSGLPVFAVCDRSVEASQRFLEHFGFVGVNDEVYQWAQ